jgi:hypothetical protein
MNLREGLRIVHHSRQPIRLGKYEAKNQTDSPIKIGQKISANRYAQGLTSARRKAPISTPTQNKYQTNSIVLIIGTYYHNARIP